MAKKENMMDLKGGLTAGLDFNKSKDVAPAPEASVEESVVPAETAAPVETPVAPVQPAVVAEQPKETAEAGKSLNELYEAKRQAEVEPRTVRIQAVVTPTIATKLDELVATNKIKSRNDLINFLLEGYLGSVK